MTPMRTGLLAGFITAMATVIGISIYEHKSRERLTGSAVTQATPAAMPMSESPDIAALRDFCKLHGVHFRIYCTPGDPEPQVEFTAFAWSNDIEFASTSFIEDGAKPSWIAQGASQESAARRLLRGLQAPPNWYPMHKKAHADRHKECPPEIEG